MSRARLLGAGSTVWSVAAVLWLLSSLELFSVLFLERKTSRSRLVEDCLDSDCGGVSPVWLRLRDSMLSMLPCRNVDDRETRLSAGCDSGL